MHNITIGRYKTGEATATRVHCDEDGHELHREQYQAHTGWGEGVRDDGTTWIMYLDEHASPLIFWGRRDEDGAVAGPGVVLG